MTAIRSIRIATDCNSCANKCCNEPYDWVYLTSSEVARLEQATGRPAAEFAIRTRNERTGNKITILRLPCIFHNRQTGECTIHADRPLICRLFPFYPEPLTGQVGLLPAQCGKHLSVLPLSAKNGWSLDEHSDEIAQWVSELWSDMRSADEKTLAY